MTVEPNQMPVRYSQQALMLLKVQKAAVAVLQEALIPPAFVYEATPPGIVKLDYVAPSVAWRDRLADAELALVNAISDYLEIARS